MLFDSQPHHVRSDAHFPAVEYVEEAGYAFFETVFVPFLRRHIRIVSIEISPGTVGAALRLRAGLELHGQRYDETRSARPPGGLRRFYRCALRADCCACAGVMASPSAALPFMKLRLSIEVIRSPVRISSAIEDIIAPAGNNPKGGPPMTRTFMACLIWLAWVCTAMPVTAQDDIFAQPVLGFIPQAGLAPRGPVPRLADGKPDLSGPWAPNALRINNNTDSEIKDIPLRPWAAES